MENKLKSFEEFLLKKSLNEAKRNNNNNNSIFGSDKLDEFIELISNETIKTFSLLIKGARKAALNSDGMITGNEIKNINKFFDSTDNRLSRQTQTIIMMGKKKEMFKDNKTFITAFEKYADIIDILNNMLSIAANTKQGRGGISSKNTKLINQFGFNATDDLVSFANKMTSAMNKLSSMLRVFEKDFNQI